ncbi:MAG: MFS transporter [Acidobacteriota bacterium]|nr:MFS transporter [Acidobacteriota bacterium]
MTLLSPRRRKLGILWTLYFVQGLPFGFQATALPVHLRGAGTSLSVIGFATALSLPWMLKIFWAPLVDRFGSIEKGKRRSWILPLQGCLIVTCAAAAWTPPGERLGLLLGLVLMMNLFAATLDVAVDGLAVDLLERSELGRGNIAQVVGYKMGMLIGGGVLLWASGWIGWAGLFLVMAALIAATLPVSFLFQENRWMKGTGAGSIHEHATIGAVLTNLKRALTHRGAGWLLLFIATYKLGESMADTMFKPFLVDAGYSPQQIGLWVGTWGMLFSILGSYSGGYLASRIRLVDALAITAALRALPVAGEWWLSVVAPSEAKVIAVTCAEHFFGGALTTALFAFMMSRVNKKIGATHYTLLAAIEVWGKQPAAWISGVITQHTSYVFIFALATVLSVAFLALLVPIRRHRGQETNGSSSP